MAKNKSPKFYSYPYNGESSADKNELAYNGAYYFKLQFDPTYEFNKNSIGLLNERDTFTFDPNSLVSSLAKLSTSKSKDTNYLSNLFKQASYKIDVTAAIQAHVNAIASAYTDKLKSVTDEMGKVISSSATYNAKSSKSSYIFLPLNSMRIERRSGVAQTTGAHANVKQAIAAEQRSKMESATKTSGSIVNAGYTENPYLGFAMTGTDFETYNIDWDLLPRNETEMGQIIKILSYFQGACLSNLNMNDKNNVKWILPPVAEMGILVTTLTTSVDPNIQDMIDARNQDLTKNAKESGLPAHLIASKTDAKTFWLKPPVQVYVSSVTIEPLENKGGVLLSSEGFPMGVKLTVQLMRCALATVRDLFRGDNRNSLDETGGDDMKRANPFA